MSEERCQVTDLVKAWCDHCRPKPIMRDLLAPERPRRGPTISAMYPGTCTLCGGWFDAGDEICAVDGYGWAEVSCWEGL